MAYTPKIKKKALKLLAKAPDHVRRKSDEEREMAKASPRDNKKTEALEDTCRIHVGSWRAIYKLNDEEIAVTVIKVGPRIDVYK